MRELKEQLEAYANSFGGGDLYRKNVLRNSVIPISVNYYLTSIKTGKGIRTGKSLATKLSSLLGASGVNVSRTRNPGQQQNIWTSGNCWNGCIKNRHSLWMVDTNNRSVKKILSPLIGQDRDRDRNPTTMQEICIEDQASIYCVPLYTSPLSTGNLRFDEVFDSYMAVAYNAVEVIKRQIPVLEEYCGYNVHMALKTISDNDLLAYHVAGLPKYMTMLGPNLITRKITL